MILLWNRKAWLRSQAFNPPAADKADKYGKCYIRMNTMIMREKLLRRQKQHLAALSILVMSAALFSGCSTFTDTMSGGAGATVGVMGAGMGMEAARELLFRGIEGIDKGQSIASMQPAAPSELAKAKRIAVQISSQGMAGAVMRDSPFGSGSVAVLDDALSVYLMQMGYEVASKDTEGSGDPMQDMMRTAMQPGAITQPGAEKSTQPSITTQQDANRMAKLRDKGVNLLISGAVSSSIKHNMKMGMFLGRTEMEMQTVISSASIRITSVSDEKLILTAMVTYKKGKTPQQVAADLSNIISRARNSVTQ